MSQIQPIQGFIGDAEWEKVERLVERFKATLLEVPEPDRRAATESATRSLLRVQTVALASRHDVTDKLSELHRGRVAMRAYDRSGGSEAMGALR